MSLKEYIASFLQTERGALFSYYLRASNAKVAWTEELQADCVFADWDADDRLVGVEVLAPLASAKSKFAVQFLTSHVGTTALEGFVLCARKAPETVRRARPNGKSAGEKRNKA